MKVIVVGGTGLLGYHCIRVGLSHGHSLDALAIKDIDLGEWFPKEVSVHYGNIFEMSIDDLIKIFRGYDAMVYAVGPDDRVVPPAPAYEFFYDKLVNACVRTVTAARDAGVKKCVILNSYFAYFDRVWPDKKLAERHPYIRCRVEQAKKTIEAGKDKMAVMVLELPYIFGSMPERVPLWKEVLLDRFTKGKLIFFPKGGTNMISAHHVGEAIIGAIEHGKHGKRYPIGDENWTYHKMLRTMMEALGTPKTIINIPRFAAVLAGIIIDRKWHNEGLESGLNSKYLMRDIITRELYFDPSESVNQLGYKLGGLKESIIETMQACYPNVFSKLE